MTAIPGHREGKGINNYNVPGQRLPGSRGGKGLNNVQGQRLQKGMNPSQRGNK